MMKSLPLGVSPRDGLSALALGVLASISFPPVGFWPGALLAVILWLRLLRERTVLEARNIGLLYGLVFGLGTMYWFFQLVGVLAIPLIALFAAYFGLLASLIGLSRGWPALARAASVALFAVAIEWLRGDAWYLRFPWYTVPHALAASPDWVAGVRWLGAYGLSYVIWFIAAWAAFGRSWYAGALVLLPVGSWFLPPLPLADRQVLLIQSEQSDGGASVIRSIAGGPVDLAVLPEYSTFESPELAMKSVHGPAALARNMQCPVVFGAVIGVYGEPDFVNVAAVLDPQGNLIGAFPKQRPLPLFRDGVPGKERPVFVMEQGTLGVAICYDYDAPEVAASLVRAGATVLVNPTYDAMEWSRIQHVHHELLLRLRAVENDRWILRAASSGRTETIDPRGVPSAQGIPIGESGSIVLGYAHRNGVPLGSYAAWLGPCSAVGSLGLLIGWACARIKGRRVSQAGRSDGGSGRVNEQPANRPQ